MGFRDSCTGSAWLCALDSRTRARERILDIAATQFADGSAYHQYQPLTKKGNLDVGSWLQRRPAVADCRRGRISQGDGRLFASWTKACRLTATESKAQPLMEHLRRSFHYTCTHLGPHGLPLIGRADWNDCLNLNCFSKTPGESFQTTANFEIRRGGVACSSRACSSASARIMRSSARR